eukprot:609183-Pyramimonas_sp.AAC.2
MLSTDRAVVCVSKQHVYCPKEELLYPGKATASYKLWSMYRVVSMLGIKHVTKTWFNTTIGWLKNNFY